MIGHRALEKKQITQGNNRKVQNPSGSPRSWTNQTKKRQLLQYQGIAGVFSLYKVRDLRHEMVTKRHTFVTNS